MLDYQPKVLHITLVYFRNILCFVINCEQIKRSIRSKAVCLKKLIFNFNKINFLPH